MFKKDNDSFYVNYVKKDVSRKNCIWLILLQNNRLDIVFNGSREFLDTDIYKQVFISLYQYNSNYSHKTGYAIEMM